MCHRYLSENVLLPSLTAAESDFNPDCNFVEKTNFCRTKNKKRLPLNFARVIK